MKYRTRRAMTCLFSKLHRALSGQLRITRTRARAGAAAAAVAAAAAAAARAVMVVLRGCARNTTRRLGWSWRRRRFC